MERIGYVKLFAGNSVTTLNYMVEDDYVYAITKGSSNKVKELNANADSVKIRIKKDEFPVEAEVISNEDVVKAYYDKFVNDKNNHYKKFIEGLVVLKFKRI